MTEKSFEQEADRLFGDVVKIEHSRIVFESRDKLGIFPIKIRTTVFIQVEDEIHTTEVENIFTNINDSLESTYQEIAKDLAIREAKNIIKGDYDEKSPN
jgi:hypothetical protein